MNDMLKGIDRASLIKAVAIYLLIYAILNGCVAVFAGLGGALSGVVGVAGQVALESGAVVDPEAQAALQGATALGGGLLIISILALISIPVLLIASYGLFQRSSWARKAAIVALAFTLLMSVFNLSTGGIINILWIVLSGFVLYLFITDPLIKAELGG